MATKDDPVDLDRLAEAMRDARQTLEYYRTERVNAVRQYAGAHYSENATELIVPVNLLARYVRVVGRALTPKELRVMLSTFDKKAKPHVDAMQKWCNDEMEQMGLSHTMGRVGVDALFSIGICKVALATPADSASSSWALPAGEAYAEVIDLDDFVFDVNATDMKEASFIGHRYRCPLEVAKKLYKNKKLTASTRRGHNAQGDERIDEIGRDGSSKDGFEEYVDLWEVYLPRRKMVVTLADDCIWGEGYAEEPLKEQDWVGPDCGPYHFLCLGVVPGNAMPKAPVMDLIDLHELNNRLYRKLGNQADRQKTIFPVRGAATDDGGRVIQTPDGEMFLCDGEPPPPLVYPGADQGNFAFFMQAKQLFSEQAGNLDLMSGAAPQSKTATQDKILNENASAEIADLQDTMNRFIVRVLTAMCWFWWHDPFKVMRTELALPGMPEMSVTRTVTPQQRYASSWLDLKIKVDPYSLRHQTPEQRVAALNQIVTTVILPMMPILQQQGIMFDINVYLTKLAAYLDLPDLAEIVSVQEPPQQEEAKQEQPGMPQETTRNYVRENVPMRTQRGNDMNLANQLMGVDPGGASNGQSNGSY